MTPPRPTRAARRYAQAYAEGKRAGWHRGFLLGLLVCVLCLWSTTVVDHWLGIGEERVVEVYVLPAQTVQPAPPSPTEVFAPICDDCLAL